MATNEDRDNALDEERSIIRNLILARINNDESREQYELDLRQAMEVTNKLVKDYFDSKGEEYDVSFIESDDRPVDKSGNESFFSMCSSYIKLYNLKRKLDENYSIGKDMDYREKSMTFATDYNLSTRLLEILDWYFSTIGDSTHNIEQFVNMVTYDTQITYAIRNELTGRKLKFSFDKEDLNLIYFRPLMLSSMKIRLTGNFTRVNIGMIKKLDEDRSADITGELLFQLLNTATFISIAKEYGYSLDDLDLENIVKLSKKAIMNYPDANGFIEAMNELDCLIKNADELANKYLTQKTK